MSTPPISNNIPRAKWDLFLISLLILFVELACIRWFPAHVLFLTFFTNIVLLAAFLGMSLGCLAAERKWDLLNRTPLLLLLLVGIALGFEVWADKGGSVDVGNQSSPEVVYFGTEGGGRDLAQFAIPIELIGAFFFLAIAVVFIGLGQQLGRSLNQIPNRVRAYTINIFGSVIGIVLFSLLSYWETSPIWWFLPASLGLAYFLWQGREKLAPSRLFLQIGALVILPFLANLHDMEEMIPAMRGRLDGSWSPYYRIEYAPPPERLIEVNKIGHQVMISREDKHIQAHAYPLPHLLNRDSGGEPFEDVLIIGAGSGNDVSRALQWGAKHVDAVEIDPAIQRFGQRDHPDKPFDDPRVTVHLDDGRNFLKSTEKKYDLIIYALVDSLVLHSSYSNIRLESYLFTRQAFTEVRSRLKPGGTFVMYNFFRQGWIVARLRDGLKEVFEQEPLVLSLPYMEEIKADSSLGGGFTLFMAGDIDPIRKQFEEHDLYWHRKSTPTPESPDGFEQNPESTKGWVRFGPAEIIPSAEPLPLADDDWPFLYLRRPMIPAFLLRSMLIMGIIALGLVWLFLPRGEGGANGWRSFSPRMFFLGAGFMLIETKAVVHMALLFGSTWIVNSVVFFAVLVMILLANLFVLKVKPERLTFYYIGLFIALGLNVVIPLDAFLGMNRVLQIVGGCLLTFTPILFAGVIFAVSFSRSVVPNLAFGANIAGAMLGGLAEGSSMLLGFRYMIVVAMVLYLFSLIESRPKPTEVEAAT